MPNPEYSVNRLYTIGANALAPCVAKLLSIAQHEQVAVNFDDE